MNTWRDPRSCEFVTSLLKKWWPRRDVNMIEIIWPIRPYFIFENFNPSPGPDGNPRGPTEKVIRRPFPLNLSIRFLIQICGVSTGPIRQIGKQSRTVLSSPGRMGFHIGRGWAGPKWRVFHICSTVSTGMLQRGSIVLNTSSNDKIYSVLYYIVITFVLGGLLLRELTPEWDWTEVTRPRSLSHWVHRSLKINKIRIRKGPVQVIILHCDENQTGKLKTMASSSPCYICTP